MNNYPTLRNAPIVEALIDIRAKVSSACDINKLEVFYDSVKEQYPEKHEHMTSGFEIHQAKDVKHLNTNVIGYRYLSADKKQVVQTKLDGFTFSRLYPYERWGNLRDEAKKLWSIYLNVAEPELISRIALRYINSIKLQMPVNLEDYFKTPPSVPEGLPQTLNGYFYRISIYNEQVDANAIITQALEPSILGAKEAQIILDIDVFRYRQDGIVEDIWDEMERLCSFKNKVFFSSITDKLKEMYL
ncbi:MAG: TIGR04255 family protein [Nitrospirae bacterium]|nr:TIGR04255 family protein [Nitrospirota bacterium]MBF0592675.1 TIGR04255 family protein [Nitrospirota bacterium]